MGDVDMLANVRGVEIHLGVQFDESVFRAALDVSVLW